MTFLSYSDLYTKPNLNLILLLSSAGHLIYRRFRLFCSTVRCNDDRRSLINPDCHLGRFCLCLRTHHSTYYIHRHSVPTEWRLNITFACDCCRHITTRPNIRRCCDRCLLCIFSRSILYVLDGRLLAECWDVQLDLQRSHYWWKDCNRGRCARGRCRASGVGRTVSLEKEEAEEDCRRGSKDGGGRIRLQPQQ